jgi:hypothetical protein
MTARPLARTALPQRRGFGPLVRPPTSGRFHPLKHAEGFNASRSWESNCCNSREGYWIKEAVVAVLLFLESTMRLRTIFPKTAARRSRYWISADCLAPSLWPTASTNASTAHNRSARAPKLLGSLTAFVQASFATFAVNMNSDAIILGPAAKASADYISSTAVSLCISATRSRSPSWDIEFIQSLRRVGFRAARLFVVPRARKLQPPTVGKDGCQESREARAE